VFDQALQLGVLIIPEVGRGSLDRGRSRVLPQRIG
jgi:hypothetical protein